jgi:hypothetical protein
LTDPVFVLILIREHLLPPPPGVPADKLDPYPDPLFNFDSDFHPDLKNNPIVLYFLKNPRRANDLLTKFFESHHDKNDKIAIKNAVKNFYTRREVVTKSRDPESHQFLTYIAPAPTPFCKPITVTKLSIPFNPTVETNVLKSSQNNSPGTSVGYGGALQLYAPGLRDLDVIGVSAQEQSLRYNSQFLSKSSDAVTTQAAYQFFLGATKFDDRGAPIGTVDTGPSHKGDIPPQNMMMIQSVAFGVQNQTIYTPSFHTESVNLTTPQATYNLQNLPFSGETCDVKIPDPRKEGFCYYTDFSFTVGQTLSNVITQQNTNFTVSATPGWRIRDTDVKLTLPITATTRIYNDVAGGRDDVLFQIGPALTYTPAPFVDSAGNGYSALFSMSATYNQNHSTVSTASWRGYIFMPTLTVAFQPKPQVH